MQNHYILENINLSNTTPLNISNNVVAQCLAKVSPSWALAVISFHMELFGTSKKNQITIF